jgi:hypothetical protein
MNQEFSHLPDKAPDHPYYHLSELPPERKEQIYLNRTYALDFVNQMFDKYLDRKTHFTTLTQELHQDLKNHPSPRVEAAIGKQPPSNDPPVDLSEVPDEVVADYRRFGAFSSAELQTHLREFKDQEILNVGRKMIKAQREHDTDQVLRWAEMLERRERLSIFDIWLSATYIMDFKAHTGRDYEISAMRKGNDFEQFATLVEEAMIESGDAPPDGERFPASVTT